MKNENQQSLFDSDEILEKWQEEWVGMPEYVSEDKKPVQQIIVSFKTYADVVEFGKRLSITITPKTNSTWFPAKAWDTGSFYVNENWGKDEK